MISSTIALPHPVLGREGDYTPETEFPLELKILEADRAVLGLIIEGTLVQKGLLGLIDQGHAQFGLEIYCASTLSRSWRPVALENGSSSAGIELDLSNLARTVEITPLVICLTPKESSLEGSSDFYDGVRFALLAGDVLGQGTTIRIVIEDEQHKPNLMSFQKSNEVEPDEYKIEFGIGLIVVMGHRCWDLFSMTRKESRLKPLMFMSIIKDALVFGLQNLTNGEEDELASWREGLLKKLESLEIGTAEGDLDDWQTANLTAQRILAKSTVNDFLTREAQVEDTDF